MSREDHIKKLVVNYERRLQKLKEQRASYGLDAPPHILTEIEDIEAEIKKLQTELEALEDSGVDEESPSGVRGKSQRAIPFFNVVVLIALWLILLVPLNNGFLTLWNKFSSCPPSKFQTLGVALILLAVVHLIWRKFRGPLERLVEGASPSTIREIGRFLLEMFPYLQPTELNDRVLGASLGVALVIASALVLLSPPTGLGVPILLDFTVQRTTPPSTEAIHPGDTLLVAPGEIVHISANVLGPAVFKCTWFTNIGTNLGIAGCSLTYSAPQSANWDNVAVLVSSPCRTDSGVFAGFHIRVAQTTP